jgi:demethoxyubiquinone hydroxylase (CLK1/Coq7/Cat5 family)
MRDDEAHPAMAQTAAAAPLPAPVKGMMRLAAAVKTLAYRI